MLNQLKADLLSFDIMEESAGLELMLMTEAYVSESITDTLKDTAASAKEKAKDAGEAVKKAVGGLKEKTDEIIEKIKEFFKKIMAEVHTKMEQRAVKKRLKNLAESFSHVERKNAKYCKLKSSGQEYKVAMKRFSELSDAMTKLYQETAKKHFNTTLDMETFFINGIEKISDDFNRDFGDDGVTEITMRVGDAIKAATDLVTNMDSNYNDTMVREIAMIDKFVTDYEKYCEDLKKQAEKDKEAAFAKMGALKRCAVKAQTAISAAGRKICVSYSKHPFIYTAAISAALVGAGRVITKDGELEFKDKDVNLVNTSVVGGLVASYVGAAINETEKRRAEIAKQNKKKYDEAVKKLEVAAVGTNASQAEIENALAILRKKYKQ